MFYIIRRLDQGGGYVSLPGSVKSYTKNPLEARQYPTREAAEADLCVDNEIIEPAFVRPRF